jgi:hypothetical protein
MTSNIFLLLFVKQRVLATSLISLKGFMAKW